MPERITLSKKWDKVASTWLDIFFSSFFIFGVICLSAFVLAYRDGGIANVVDFGQTFPLIFADPINTFIVLFTVFLAYFLGYSHLHASYDPFEGDRLIHRPDVVHSNALLFQSNLSQALQHMRAIWIAAIKITIYQDFVGYPPLNNDPDAILNGNFNLNTIIDQKLKNIQNTFLANTSHTQILITSYRDGFIYATNGSPRTRWNRNEQVNNRGIDTRIIALGNITKDSGWIENFITILNKEDDPHKNLMDTHKKFRTCLTK